MIWTRLMTAAAAVLMLGAFAVSAQDSGKDSGKDSGIEEAPETPKAETDKPAIDPNSAPEGKLKVASISEVKLTDKTREKDLTLSAWYPEDEGSYPVIFFSHGANAGHDAGAQLAEYWASHGYVVLLPRHADARKTIGETMLEQYDADGDGKLSKEEVPERLQSFFDTLDTDGDGFLSREELDSMGRMGGNRGRRGGEQPEAPRPPRRDGEDEFSINPADFLLEDPAQPAPPQPERRQPRQGRQGRGFGAQPALDAKSGIERVGDISFVLSNAEALVKAAPALKGKLDLEKVAVAGHNAGAYTAQLIGGASLTVEEDIIDEDGTEWTKKETRNLLDKRVKAILALSPAGPDQGGLSKESFKGIKVPAMNVTGSNDNTGEGQDAEWKKQAHALSGEGGKYQLFIEGASNFSFTAPRRSFRRGGEQPTDNTFEWVKTGTLQFLNATLKGDAEAASWLKGDALKKATDGAATIESK
jgi:predicted dienelactone hydrolase